MTLFFEKKAKVADNIAIYGITVLTKKAILQVPLKKGTSILLNIDIPCSPTPVIWRTCRQCVPGSFSLPMQKEPGDEARVFAFSIDAIISSGTT